MLDILQQDRHWMKNTAVIAAMYGDAISMRVDKVVREGDARITFLTCCVRAHATYAVLCPTHFLTLHAGSTDFYRVVHGQGMQQLVLVHERRGTKCQVHELLPKRACYESADS
jgi:hypothetical protein